MQAGYELVAAALAADRSPVHVPAEERRRWLMLAGRSLLNAQQYLPAAQIAVQFHDYPTARKDLLKSGACPPCCAEAARLILWIKLLCKSAISCFVTTEQ